MRKLLIASIVSSTLIAPLAVADNKRGFYLGAGASLYDSHKLDVQGDSIEFRTMEFYAGYKYNGYLGVEIRGGLSPASEDYELAGAADGDPNLIFEDSMDGYGALYWRPESANEVAKLYGLLGFAAVSSTTKQLNAAGNEISSESSSNAGFSYGVGVGFVINKRFNLNFEYKSLFDTDDAEYTGFNANIDFRF